MSYELTAKQELGIGPKSISYAASEIAKSL